MQANLSRYYITINPIYFESVGNFTWKNYLQYVKRICKVMAGCRINLCYEELVIARTCRLTVCGRPIVRSNGCETIVLRIINVRKKLVVTLSVLLGDLWPAYGS